MKDLMQRSSLRGRNLLESVTRALSPSRSHVQSPSRDKTKSNFKGSVKNTIAKLENSRHVEEKVNSVKEAQDCDAVLRRENKGQLNDKPIKSKRLRSSSSSGNNSSHSDSSFSLNTGSKTSGGKYTDQRSSSGASSQNSGGSTPTKSSIVIEYLRNDKPEKVQESDYHDNDNESIYESRKLLFRKMVELEVKEIRKNDADDITSIADSWDDLEENFAKIYEPIALKTQVQRNSKDELLSNISNPSIRHEISKMSHDEILYNLNFINESRDLTDIGSNDKYYSKNEMLDSGFSPSSDHKVLAEVHRSQSDSSDSEITYYHLIQILSCE